MTRPEDRLSLARARAAVAHIGPTWPAARPRLERQLARIEARTPGAAPHIARWRALLAAGPAAIAAAVLAETEEGQVLRSISPWAGIVPTAERRALLRRHRAELEAPCGAET